MDELWERNSSDMAAAVTGVSIMGMGWNGLT